MNRKYKKYIPVDEIEEFNSGKLTRAFCSFGCHYIPELGEHRFLLWAPNAEAVSLVGDFNRWDCQAAPMEKVAGGFWICFVPGLIDGGLYKYCVTGADGCTRMKADPFASRGQSGADTASMVWTGEEYSWSDAEFMSQRAKKDIYRSPMSIYEVHPGSWRSLPDNLPGYRALGDLLSDYCREMGFTHVELMPITDSNH